MRRSRRPAQPLKWASSRSDWRATCTIMRMGNAPVLSLMLAVPDAPVAVEWYKRALGAKLLWSLGSVVGLEIEGAPFFLGQPENNGWETPQVLGQPTCR